jgi:hypothetical protein
VIRSPAEAQSALGRLQVYCQHLTSLKMQGSPQLFPQLAFPNLQELHLGCVCCVQLGPTADGYPGAIQGCPQLTKLELQCDFIGPPAGGKRGDSLSSLVNLRHLEITSDPAARAQPGC